MGRFGDLHLQTVSFVYVIHQKCHIETTATEIGHTCARSTTKHLNGKKKHINWAKRSKEANTLV